MRTYMGILIIILGVISGIIFFVSGLQLNRNGNDMKELRSQGGNSVAEFYYQDMGVMNKGIGLLADALGIGIITISIGMGTTLFVGHKDKNISNSENKEKVETEKN